VRASERLHLREAVKLKTNVPRDDWHWSLGDWRRKVGHEGNENAT
jgi:hypothetical protein